MKFSAMDNYGGLMRTVFIGPVLQDLGISWQTCLEKFGKYGLVGRDVSLGIGVEIPKACTTPIYLSATAPVLCLSGVMLPTQSSWIHPLELCAPFEIHPYIACLGYDTSTALKTQHWKVNTWGCSLCLGATVAFDRTVKAMGHYLLSEF